MPAAAAGSGSCSSLTLFQMFSQLHTWWAHGWSFPCAAEQVCDPRGHLSRALSTDCLSKPSELLSIDGTAGAPRFRRSPSSAGLCVLGGFTSASQAGRQNSGQGFVCGIFKNNFGLTKGGAPELCRAPGRQHLPGTSGQTLAHVVSPLQTLARRRRPDVRARPPAASCARQMCGEGRGHRHGRGPSCCQSWAATQ